MASQTSIPQLTTTFTPQAWCTENYYQWNNTQGYTYTEDGAIQTYGFFSLGPPSTSVCLPSDWSPETTAYFSPGVCPSGYDIACSTAITIGSLVETRATCCPIGFYCQTQSDWPWYSTEQCTYSSSNTEPWIYTTFSDDAWVTATATSDFGFNAYGISIRYQASDFATTSAAAGASETFSPGSGPAIPTAIKTGTGVSSSSTAGASENSGSGASSALSTGAKAGIGVGAAVGILLLAAIGLLIYRMASRKRPGEQDAPSQDYMVQPQGEAVPELHSEHRRFELDPGSKGPVYELQSNEVQVHEAPSPARESEGR